MKIFNLLFIITGVAALLAGCAGRHAQPDTQHNRVDVFGVQLHSTVDHREVNGVKGVEEPCLKGSERNFDALDIIIGYGFDGRVRKITTRNPQTGMFGVRPGMTHEEGRAVLLRAGFIETAPPYIFKMDDSMITLLVDERKMIFGLKLEAGDERQ